MLFIYILRFNPVTLDPSISGNMTRCKYVYISSASIVILVCGWCTYISRWLSTSSIAVINMFMETYTYNYTYT